MRGSGLWNPNGIRVSERILVSALDSGRVGLTEHLFRLAIIRDGTRLLIVDEHETVISPDDPPHISDTENTTIVQNAVNRLTP